MASPMKAQTEVEARASSPHAAVARSVSKTYPGGVSALEKVDLEIPAGEITALVGANASGKTTLLGILAGRLLPSSGSVTVLGADPSAAPERLRARIGYVSQDVALDPEMTGKEILWLFASLHGIPRSVRPGRISDLSKMFGLGEHLERRVSTYSGGLRRRLHLALGLVHDPELLLLDEPTSGLDPRGREVIWDAMRRKKEGGGAVAVATHDLADVERHCQHVAFIERGELLVQATPEEIRSRHATHRVAVRLDQPVSEPGTLRERLTSLPGVTRARCEGTDLSVETPSGEDVTESILKVLKAMGVEVVLLEVQRPDLSSAYFNLTGHPVAPSSRERGAAGGDGDRKERSR